VICCPLGLGAIPGYPCPRLVWDTLKLIWYIVIGLFQSRASAAGGAIKFGRLYQFSEMMTREGIPGRRQI
jgi:hypothetical protein